MDHWSATNPELNALFHRLWTKAVGQPGYDKAEWLKLEKLIGQLSSSNAPTQKY